MSQACGVLDHRVGGIGAPTLAAPGREEASMSASAESIRPGIAWNATRVASVLIVVIIAAVALAFSPSFSGPDAAPPQRREAHAAAQPHEPTVVDGRVCAQCLP
jgi:hypothetical protein